MLDEKEIRLGKSFDRAHDAKQAFMEKMPLRYSPEWQKTYMKLKAAEMKASERYYAYLRFRREAKSQDATD